jgi:phosphoribosylformimino-5-aminoimidazole carboxamide ribotide isomerase
MRVIPVLDLKAGQAVHAIAGDRAHYRSLRGLVHRGSDPIGLARAYRDVLGFTELYLADLDAIAGAPPARDLYEELGHLGLRLWADAGVRDRSGVPPLIDSGVSIVVLGLETLRGPDALAALVSEMGPDRLAFSLDLRGGRPVIAPGASWGTEDPLALAARAVESGIRRLLILDLARVGLGSGVGTLPLARTLGLAHPGVEIAVGGGVSGPGDLMAAFGAGVAAVLVGSALHDGRIGPRELARFRQGCEPG